MSGYALPVDRGNERVQGESRVVGMVLTPDAATGVFAVMWWSDGIVSTGDNDQKPREDCEDLVSRHSLSIVALAFRERIGYRISVCATGLCVPVSARTCLDPVHDARFLAVQQLLVVILVGWACSAETGRTGTRRFVL